MTQTIAAYAIFAAAVAWLAWRMVMPATLRSRIKARLGRKDCGGDCGCS